MCKKVTAVLYTEPPDFSDGLLAQNCYLFISGSQLVNKADPVACRFEQDLTSHPIFQAASCSSRKWKKPQMEDEGRGEGGVRRFVVLSGIPAGLDGGSHDFICGARRAKTSSFTAIWSGGPH